MAVGVLYMLYRRLIAHTPRLFGLKRAEQRYRDEPHWEGVLILFFILLIVVGGLLYDHASSEEVVEVAWRVHNMTVLAFLCLLPLSKHFHIITRSRTCSSPSCRRDDVAAAAGDHARAGRAGGGAAQAAGRARRRRLARRPELEAGARRVHVHRVRPLHRGVPGHRRRHAAGAAAAHPRPARPAVPRERGRAADPGRGAVVVHDLHGVRRGVPGRDRARADDRRHAPQPGRQGRDGPAAPADAPELRRPGQLARQVGAHAGPLDEGTRLQDPGRAQGARAVRVVRRRLRVASTSARR